MKNLLTIFICFSFAASSCQKLGLCKDQELDISRLENTTGKLKLNGYFAGIDLNASNQEFSLIYLLYENGVFYNYGSVDALEAQAGTIEFSPSVVRLETKSYWGVYKIEEDRIEIQSWLPTQLSCHHVQIENGTIQNDSTFSIRFFSSTKNSDEDSANFVFRFVPYSPKPDSTNSFIQ